jgi:MSHA biogenesis protein MshO
MTSSRGFTLMELIIVIVIMGIIAGVAAVFISGPVAGYVDSNRRAQLSDSADIAVRRISRDLRLALPNSVRVGGSNKYLEYIPTTIGSRYRANGGGDILDFTTTDSSFDYLGDSIAGSTGFVVVFNTGQRSVSGCATAPGGADAYEGCNRTAISAVTASKVTISSATFRFPFASPGNRFHIVPATGPVTLACEPSATLGINSAGDGNGTLRIYSNYATGSGDWGSAAPSAAPSGGGLTNYILARYVSGCTFVYTPGITASNGLVTLLLTLTRSNETVTLHHQVHVDNVP